MFTFNFSKGAKDSVCNQQFEISECSQVEWYPAKEIKIGHQFLHEKRQLFEYTEKEFFHKISLKIINLEKVINKLKEDNFENILEAENQQSDLIPAKYEGGLKIWECTYDLGYYLFSQNIPKETERVLDLGCGVGLIGLISFINGSSVDFQDYNSEVIESVTVPNVALNCNDSDLIIKNCKFYSGDWRSFADIVEDKIYDYIFTSETIYNQNNHKKLYEIFKEKLKTNGVGLVAAKTHYFGVGGNIRQFEKLILEDDIFQVKTVWKSCKGLQREILELRRKISL